MNIEILPVTDAEFELVKEDFEVNARALAAQITLIVDEETVIPKQKKTWIWAGVDKSKYLKTLIDGETYIVAAINIFNGVITEVLAEAAVKYPENFGNHNAHDVVQAIYKTRPLLGFEDLSKFEYLLSTEQFAMAFKINDDGTVDRNVLRLDLFRMIKESQEKKDEYEFVGGLFHAYKHFRLNGLPLSTNKGENNLSHPSELMGMILKSFFQAKHKYVEGKKGFTTEIPIADEKILKCSFYPEQEIEVSFLNTVYIK